MSREAARAVETGCPSVTAESIEIEFLRLSDEPIGASLKPPAELVELCDWPREEGGEAREDEEERADIEPRSGELLFDDWMDESDADDPLLRKRFRNAVLPRACCSATLPRPRCDR